MEVPDEYYRSLQFLFRTSDVKYIYFSNNVWIFEIDGDFLVAIIELGDGNWTMKVLNSNK